MALATTKSITEQLRSREGGDTVDTDKLVQDAEERVEELAKTDRSRPTPGDDSSGGPRRPGGGGPGRGTTPTVLKWLVWSDPESDSGMWENNRTLFTKMPPHKRITNLYAKAIGDYVRKSGGEAEVREIKAQWAPPQTNDSVPLVDQYVVVSSPVKENNVSEVLSVAREFARKKINEQVEVGIFSDIKDPAGLYLDYIESGIVKKGQRPPKMGNDGFVDHQYIAHFQKLEQGSGSRPTNPRPTNPTGGTEPVGGDNGKQKFNITKVDPALKAPEEEEEDGGVNKNMLNWAVFISSVLVIWKTFT